MLGKVKSAGQSADHTFTSKENILHASGTPIKKYKYWRPVFPDPKIVVIRNEKLKTYKNATT